MMCCADDFCSIVKSFNCSADGINNQLVIYFSVDDSTEKQLNGTPLFRVVFGSIHYYPKTRIFPDNLNILYPVIFPLLYRS